MLCAAPARPLKGCVGAFVLLVCLSSCERTPFKRAESLDVGGDTIQLAPGVEVHDVQVRNSTDSDFAPASVDARSGDVVRFTTTDSRTHLIEFDEASLPGNALSLFQSKTQLRSPPLLVQGATWVVSLENAPAGTYTFLCSTHNARGTLTVH
jgi:plastocyanin